MLASQVKSCQRSDSPLDAVLDELVRGDALAELSAAAVDPLVQPTIRIDTDGLGRPTKQRSKSEATMKKDFEQRSTGLAGCCT